MSREHELRIKRLEDEVFGPGGPRLGVPSKIEQIVDELLEHLKMIEELQIEAFPGMSQDQIEVAKRRIREAKMRLTAMKKQAVDGRNRPMPLM